MRYQCDVCGCYLDPDEGRVCEDCREQAERHAEAARQREKMFVEQYDGQMKLAV